MERGPGPYGKPPCAGLLGRRLHFMPHGFRFSSHPPLLPLVAFPSASTFAAPPTPRLFPTSLHYFLAAISRVCMAACSAPSRLRLPYAHASLLAAVLRRLSLHCPCPCPRPCLVCSLLFLPCFCSASHSHFKCPSEAVPLQLGVAWASLAVAVLRHQSCAQLLPWLLLVSFMYSQP